ncbi:MAG: tetratricopeptide repeat protein [Bacteroidetes bacterium]|nr:tetratricopeptide repeat protein [Bacteroidota bacterium]
MIQSTGCRLLFRSLLFAAVTTVFTVNAQQTQKFVDAEKAYEKGLDLFDASNFLSARQKFEEIYKTGQPLLSNGNEVLRQNLEYYIAVCAAETNDKDAEQLLLNYMRNYHETDKRRQVYLYLGKYYYKNARYAEAAEQLAKVNINDLYNEQIYDYKFMLGYSYFTKKKFKEARPLFASIVGIKEKYFYPSNYYFGFICFYEKDYNQALKSFKDIEDSKMYATVIPYYIAQIYYLKKNFATLLPYLKTVTAREGILYKSEMNFMLGQVYFQQGEYISALPLLEAYISKAQKVNQEDIYQLAYCQYQTGAYVKAIENFKQLNLLNDKLGQNATYALADCYLKTNQKDKARSAFQSVISMQHDVTLRENALYNYAKLSFEFNFISEAIQSFEDYLLSYENGKYTDDVNEMLAAALVQTRNYDRAYQLMEKMKLQSNMIKEAYQKVTYFRAVELYNDANKDQALKLCDKSLLYNYSASIYALAVYLKAEILYVQQNYNDAIQQYMKYTAIASATIGKSDASKFRAAYNIAYAYFKQKRYADATVYFASAIDEAATTTDTKGKQALLPDLYLRYADCLFVTKSYQKSVDAYSELVAKNWPSAEYAQFQKGIILGLLNRDDDKIAALNILLTTFPTSTYADQAYYEIAETHLANSNFAASQLSFQTLISKYPASSYVPRSYLNLAVIAYNSGKKEQALDNYKTVVKRFPETSEAKESIDALKELYVEVGRADEYFDFVKANSNVVITDAEQDSLTYQSALKAYDANDCNRSISLFDGYIRKFPAGYFIGEVYWKKADCHLRVKDYSAAIICLDGVIQNRYGKYYEKALLKASGIAYFELKKYEEALSLYKQLYLAATSQSNTYTAMLGMLQTSAKLVKQDDVIEYADQLINSRMAKEADLQEAYYLKGKAYYAKNDGSFALGAFNRVTEFPVNEKCVESKYMVARILFETGNYKASLDTCLRLKNKYASYEYWMAKTFVLMADNYYATGNAFQAKATLESIVQNYDGDPVLLNEAREKLENIRLEEWSKSKIMQVVPSDTLQMESDSLFNGRP